MGDWRDSVRSQRSEKTDAVSVCRKTGGWTLCFGPDATLKWVAIKCYRLLTRARQWVTAIGPVKSVDLDLLLSGESTGAAIGLVQTYAGTR